MLNLSASEPLDESPFRWCQSLAELIAVGDLVCGRDLALYCLRVIRAERQPLQNAVRELRRVGRKELAAAVAEVAAQAPKAPWWHAKRQPGRWRTPSAEICIARRKAERRAAEGR
jgi:hypothetical protein